MCSALHDCYRQNLPTWRQTHVHNTYYRMTTSTTGAALKAHAQGAHRAKRYVIFSATSRSPTSYVGNMDSEGMNRGSATNLHGNDLSRYVGSHNPLGFTILPVPSTQNVKETSGIAPHCGTGRYDDRAYCACCTAQL